MAQRTSTHRGSDDSKRRILQATLELVTELGYEGTTIARVSKRSGLPSGSVYWHFSSKDELIETMIQDTYDRWRELHFRADANGGPQIIDLGAMLAAASDDSDPSHGFWHLGLILALEKRMEASSARRKFLGIRRELTVSSTAHWRDRIQEERGIDDPVLASTIAQLTLAALDGLLIALAAGELDDPAGSTEILTEAVNLLVPKRKVE